MTRRGVGVLAVVLVVGTVVVGLPKLEGSTLPGPLRSDQSAVLQGADTSSSLTDPAGDASPAYLDAVTAEVMQVGDGLQLSMTLAGDVPQTLPSDRGLTYLWLVDTDRNPATGQPHRFVGSEYNVRLCLRQGHWEGIVDVINPGAAGGGAGTVMVAGRTVTIRIGRDQIGSPSAFTWEIESFSDSAGDSADSFATQAVSAGSPTMNGIARVTVSPARVSLSSAATTRYVSADPDDGAGSALSLAGRRVSFFSTNPTSVTVSDLGLATWAGGPSTQVAATVDGVLSANMAEVDIVDSSYFLKPYNLHLSTTHPNGQLRVVDSLGTEIHDGVTFGEFDTSLIAVLPSGQVTALRQERPDEIGTWVLASVNGEPVANSSVLRVLSEDYDVTFQEYPGEDTILYSPLSILGEDINQYVTRYEIPRVNDSIYRDQLNLMGTSPFQGGRQAFEVDFGENEADRVCGISGNPVRLGWNIRGGTWQNCYLVPFTPPRSPQWFVIYHEVGHNTSCASGVFGNSIGFSPHYNEGVASYLSLSGIKRVVDNPQTFGLGADALQSLAEERERKADAFLAKLDTWTASGAPFASLDADLVDGILLHLESSDTTGCFVTRFFRLWRPDVASLLAPVLGQTGPPDGPHTLFAAACSAAATLDLHDTFKNVYHYPIDESLYTQAYQAFLAVPWPASVKLLGPPEGASSMKPPLLLDWADVPGAVSYELYLGTSNPPPLHTLGLRTTGAVIELLLPGTTYFWKVKAIGTCPANMESPTRRLMTAPRTQTIRRKLRRSGD